MKVILIKKSIIKDLPVSRENFSKPEVEPAVTKQVNNLSRKQMVEIERKSESNEQYSRRECSQIIQQY